MAFNLKRLAGATVGAGIIFSLRNSLARRLGRDRTAERRDREDTHRKQRAELRKLARAQRRAIAGDDPTLKRRVADINAREIELERQERERISDQRRTEDDRRGNRRRKRSRILGNALLGLFAAFGMPAVGVLARSYAKDLTFGDLLRKVITSRFFDVAVLGGAIAYTVSGPKRRDIEVVTLSAMYVIGERLLQACKALCPRESGALAQSLRVVYTVQQRDHYDIQIVSDLPYFNEVAARTGFIHNAFASIRRDIPIIAAREAKRSAAGNNRRNVSLRLPEVYRTQRNTRLGPNLVPPSMGAMVPGPKYDQVAA